MDNEKIAFIKGKLVKKLTPSRYEHTIGVAYTAASLAMCYGSDVEQAYIAGLLHDCAKYLSDEKLLEKCEKYGLPISEDQMRQPNLLHAELGAYFAEYKYGITSEAICHAICYHTTGCPGMSLLDMIIYVSDFIEPNRDRAPKLAYYRKLAFEDIRQCTYEILGATIDYISEKNGSIDKTTIRSYESLKNGINNNQEENDNGSKKNG